MTDFLKLLRHVPDEDILAVATEEFIMHDPDSCVCGRLIQQATRRLANVDIPIDAYNESRMRALGSVGVELDEWANEPDVCAELYGGSVAAWTDLFNSVTSYDRLPKIELAFVKRVDEAVCGR